MKKYLLIIFCIIQLTVKGQYPHSKIWYFGYNAGIDFNSGSAVVLTNGNMTSIDGCATITDKSGKLLFYSDGQKLWNKAMTVTANGDSLMGAASSCQSAIFIPMPGDSTKLVMATIDMIENNGAKGLRYNIIDMTLNGGKGDIVSGQKNILLTKPACEKIIAVPHSNRKDIWLITYKAGTDSILSYLITSSGVNKTPVRSNTGYSISGDLNKTLGYLKASRNFKKLASAHYLDNKVLLMDFNNSTGKVSNTLSWGVTSPDGVEFSPNDTFLYISGFRGPAALYQYNVTSNNSATIKGSEKTIYTFSGGYDVGALQLGPDNKIYLAKNKESYLGVINSPNKSNTACNFVSNGLYLNGKISAYGLPNYYYSDLSPETNNIRVLTSDKLNIFPNPGNGYISIINTDNYIIQSICIFDGVGKSIINKLVNANSCFIDLSAHKSGIYMIHVTTGEGTFIYKWQNQ